MALFQTIVDIDAPPDTVWPIIRDVERWHDWTRSITSVKLLGGRPFAVGTRALVRQPKLPPAFWVVTEVEPHGFTWVSRGPGLTATGRHYVVPRGAGSRVTLSLEYEGLFAGLMAWMAGGITARYIGYEAEGLKRRAESLRTRT
ncbi:MAG: SRPBCC family protein [Vicinamibacterales bacterium]